MNEQTLKLIFLHPPQTAYYVAFGPHGPRTPTSQPGDNFKILLSTFALVGVAGVLFFTLKQFGACDPSPPPSLPLLGRIAFDACRFVAAPPPKTLTKEWQEASNERALEMKLNPITGVYFPISLAPLAPLLVVRGFWVLTPPITLGISSEGYTGKGFVQSK